MLSRFKRDVCFSRFSKNVAAIFFASETIEMAVTIIVFKIHWFAALLSGPDFIGESSHRISVSILSLVTMGRMCVNRLKTCHVILLVYYLSRNILGMENVSFVWFSIELTFGCRPFPFVLLKIDGLCYVQSPNQFTVSFLKSITF